jgi:hypothetical protein
VLRRATAAWNERETAFSIHLGDIVDVRQRHFTGLGTTQERYDYALDMAIGAFNRYKRQTFHVVGNHCVGCFPRRQLLDEYVYILHLRGCAALQLLDDLEPVIVTHCLLS